MKRSELVKHALCCDKEFWECMKGGGDPLVRIARCEQLYCDIVCLETR